MGGRVTTCGSKRPTVQKRKDFISLSLDLIHLFYFVQLNTIAIGCIIIGPLGVKRPMFSFTSEEVLDIQT